MSHNDNKPTEEEAKEAVRTLIRWAGDNPDREGLKNTPKRVIKAFNEYYSGYDKDAKDALSRTFNDVGGYEDIVLLKDIPIHSHCEHHMAPFIGKTHIAYIPNKKVVGLSKLARVTEIFSRRLQTQETMTEQISKAIEEHLSPKGSIVLVDAEHQCMTLRGIRKPGVSTITTSFKGIMDTDKDLQDRFFNLIK